MNTQRRRIANPVYAYRRPPELDGTARHCGVRRRRRGAGGTRAAIDLAQRGIPVLVLDDDDTVSVGSRAICYAKRTLEILDRLGCGEPIASKGVGWNVGKVYHGSELAYHVRPAARGRPSAARVRQPAAVPPRGMPGRARAGAGAARSCAGAQGRRRRARRRPRARCASPPPTATTRSTCDWLIVCDGARSPVRDACSASTPRARCSAIAS